VELVQFSRRTEAGTATWRASALTAGYSVTLPPGSYTVIGGLSGEPGGPAPESCDATIKVVVTAHGTTRADFVCHGRPVNVRPPASAAGLRPVGVDGRLA